jgi:hypothetical protein
MTSTTITTAASVARLDFVVACPDSNIVILPSGEGGIHPIRFLRRRYGVLADLWKRHDLFDRQTQIDRLHRLFLEAIMML